MLHIERTITGAEPITLNEAKQYLRVLYDNDDDVITQLITQARQTLEQATNLSLVEKEITLKKDNYKNSYRFPYGPVMEVTKLELEGEDISDSVNFGLVKHTGTGTIVAEYKAGGVEQEGMKQAILELVAFFFMNRGTSNDYPASVRRWIMNHTLNSIA